MLLDQISQCFEFSSVNPAAILKVSENHIFSSDLTKKQIQLLF